MDKLKLWNGNRSWEEAEQEWNRGADEAARLVPLKKLKILPEMPGITSETAKNLKWKSLKWMISEDTGGKIRRAFFKHPLKYAWSLIRSLTRKKSYLRKDDFFYYGTRDLEEFRKYLENPETLLVLGFSYCHKPFECPSGRFTPNCLRNPEHPVCRQCFIGKAIHALPEDKSVPILIPTIHYIGEKIFELVHKHPQKRILFIITACELTLEMFGDWGNMVDICGIGVRLDGRICNTMKAFELSEKGIKPGLTVVLDETQKQVLSLIRHRREKMNYTNSRK